MVAGNDDKTRITKIPFFDFFMNFWWGLEGRYSLSARERLVFATALMTTNDANLHYGPFKERRKKTQCSAIRCVLAWFYNLDALKLKFCSKITLRVSTHLWQTNELMDIVMREHIKKSRESVSAVSVSNFAKKRSSQKFNSCVTSGRTNTPSYRDARTHLKMEPVAKWRTN